MDKAVKRTSYAVIALAVVFIVLFSIAPAINIVANPEVAYSLDKKDGGRSFLFFLYDVTNDYAGFGTYGVLTIGLFALVIMSIKRLNGKKFNENIYNAILAIALFWMLILSFSSIFNMSYNLDVQLDSEHLSALTKEHYSSYYGGSIAISALQFVSVLAIFFVSGFHKTVGNFFKGLGCCRKAAKTENAPVEACSCETAKDEPTEEAKTEEIPAEK